MTPLKVVPFSIGGRQFAVPIHDIRDVLPPQPITQIHPAPPDIVGLLNLRGRIITVIDLRARFGLAPLAEDGRAYGVVVEHAGEGYSILADRIADAIGLSPGDRMANLRAIDPRVRDVASGAYGVRDDPLVVLDLARLFRLILKCKS
jgi:purine-binding chemotaxis protein CheW